MQTLLFVPAVAVGAPRPNLLFMMADQLRWDAVGYANPAQQNVTVLTPGLDRLAAEGVAMAYSCSSTPTCTPARAGLLTGRRPWGHGMLGYGAVAPFYPQGTFPRVLRDSAGYITASMGKDHFGWNATTDSGVPHGYSSTVLYDGLGGWDPKKGDMSYNDNYDQWFEQQLPGKDPQATLDGLDGDGWNGWHGAPYVYEEQYHPTAWLGRQANGFLQGYAANAAAAAAAAAAANGTTAAAAVAPFLLKVSFHRPHSPYDPPQRLLDRIKAADLAPMAVCDGSGVVPGDDWCLRFRGQSKDPSGCSDKPDAWCGQMPVNDTDFSRRAYLASVAFVDEQVASIHATLASTGLLENTFVIWTADHGDGQGDMHHWRKGYPYEFSAHVPMLMRWPERWAAAQAAAGTPVKVARGATLAAPIVTELRDVYHTLVDAAGLGDNASAVTPFGGGGVTAFDATDGKSMLCLLRDPSGATCDYPPNPGPWRPWLDMEHSTCYNETNHWSALTDGRMKYVFRAWAPDLATQEQLFNLTADPGERVQLSQHAAYGAELARWRGRMAKQFQDEGRGAGWVAFDGTLLQRTKSTTYGPNYPAAPTPAPAPPAAKGDPVVLAPNGGGVSCDTDDCWQQVQQQGGGAELQLLGSTAGALCLSTAPAAPGLNLTVDACVAGTAAQNFSTRAHGSSTTTQPAAVVHGATGQCVTAWSDTAVSLAPCGSPVPAAQQFVFGASGRLCCTAFGSRCVHVARNKDTF